MSCFNPNLIEGRLDPDTGKINYVFLGSASYCDPSTFGSLADISVKGSYKAVIPCGKCLGCRIDYTRDWTNRMCFELIDQNYKAIFLTLTYNDTHLPRSDSGAPTLSKRDLQLFWKRLRKSFSNLKLRYYVCGEYGPSTFRPHYHAIVFGLSLSDFDDLNLIGCNELKDPYFTSPLLESIWQNGFILLSAVSYKTCSYVARYVTKKFVRSSPAFSDREPEFNLSSRCPGIGFINSEKYVSSGHAFFDFPFPDGVHRLSLPKSFITHLKKIDSDIDNLSYILYNRSEDAYSRLCTNLNYFDISYLDFLHNKRDKLFSSFKLLPERL